MGLPPEAKEKVKAAFGACITFSLKGDPTVAIVDFMQYVKAIPEGIITKDQTIRYFVERVKWLMLKRGTKLHTVIVMVDGKPIPVKRMIEHEKRYKNKNVYPGKGKKYLPTKGSDLIPIEWIRFAGNYKLLQRELYPELFNAFITCRFFTPNPGQLLVLSGFPGRSEYQTVYTERPWEARVESAKAGRVLMVKTWEDHELPISPAMEKEDPDLYHRVYCVEHVPPCPEYQQGAIRLFEWEGAKNDVSEADIRMFWFEHWYQNEHIMFVLNDGDIFSIGLLYAFERCVAIGRDGSYVFRNKHTACLPYKKKKGNEIFAADAVPKEEFVDLNMFYELVREYEPMKAAGVQNPVLTQVFLMIMAGSDFFKDFMKGIGVKVVWTVFYENIQAFTHLVMKSEGVTGDTRTKRTLVIDEDKFIRFIRFCYIEKYEKALLKNDDTVTYEQLSERTRVDAKGVPKEDVAYHLPHINTIRLWCRQIEWNLLYWMNGPFGHAPDPFELWHGIPYYPYMRDPQDGSFVMTDYVSSRPKPVDEVYSQHLYRTRVLDKKKNVSKKRDRVEVDGMLDAYEHNVKSIKEG